MSDVFSAIAKLMPDTIASSAGFGVSADDSFLSDTISSRSILFLSDTISFGSLLAFSLIHV